MASIAQGGGGSADEGTALLVPSIFNLVNNVAGAGLLTLSYGMSKGTGWVSSILLCCVLGAISCHTFILIGDCCSMLNERDFKGVWSRTISESTTYVVDVIIGLMCLAASIIYSGVLGDVSTEMLNAKGIKTTRAGNISIITALVLFPLSLLKNLSALSFTSVLGFASILYTVAFIAYRSFDGSYSLGSPASSPGEFLSPELVDKMALVPKFDRASKFSVSFSSLVLMSNLGLAFIAHYNAPSYYREMRKKSEFKAMVRCSFLVLTCVYAVTMATGWRTFGDNCLGNIILNYHPSDYLSTLGRAATGISILFGFPLTFCGVRDSVLSVSSHFKINYLTTRRTLVVVMMLSIVTFVASAVEDISLVVGVTGATMGAAIVYILPPIMYSRAIAVTHGKDSELYRRSRGNYALVPIGVVFAVLGVWMTVKGD